jgi:hypothetical protein
MKDVMVMGERCDDLFEDLVLREHDQRRREAALMRVTNA